MAVIARSQALRGSLRRGHVRLCVKSIFGSLIIEDEDSGGMDWVDEAAKKLWTKWTIWTPPGNGLALALGGAGPLCP